MINKLRRALIRYFMREYNESAIEAYENTKQHIIGLAYTDLSEEQPDGTIKDEAHTMEIVLDMSALAIIYKCDDKEVARFTYATENDLADSIEGSSFDGFYDDIHDYLPPEIC